MGDQNLRPRSTAAIVWSRADAPAAPEPVPAVEAGGHPRRWPAVIAWVLLGAAIAAAWGLLLLGDSLKPISG
jgi:hypothetical protein